MEFNFNAESIFSTSNKPNNISVLKNSDIKALSKTDQDKVCLVLDKFGDLSAKAQDLKSVITNYSKFLISNDQKIYIQAKRNTVYGFLKIGFRKLFIHDKQAKMHELNPLCVLDFYVHESQQRSGIGKKLFEAMLMDENIHPALIAYDRPSIKLISFLKKNYDLVEYVPQNNNYVVYDKYYDVKSGKNIDFNNYDNKAKGGFVSSMNKNNYSNNNTNINNNKFSETSSYQGNSEYSNKATYGYDDSSYNSKISNGIKMNSNFNKFKNNTTNPELAYYFSDQKQRPSRINQESYYNNKINDNSNNCINKDVNELTKGFKSIALNNNKNNNKNFNFSYNSYEDNDNKLNKIGSMIVNNKSINNNISNTNTNTPWAINTKYSPYNNDSNVSRIKGSIGNAYQSSNSMYGYYYHNK